MREVPLLQVEALRVAFPARGGLLRRRAEPLLAVGGVSFELAAGQTMGLVGESGSGKSTIARCILRLLAPSGGRILYRGRDITAMDRRAFLPLRRCIQMVFQDPYGSLDPRMTVATIAAEPLRVHEPKLAARERRRRVAAMLERVGLAAAHLDRHPHELSGGQRQRVAIARALVVSPELVVCDEPVSALDVSVQAQILNLLKDLQEGLGLSYLFIAHDLAVVEFMSDEVLVMQEGRIVERAGAEAIYRDPRHPYTARLLAAVPQW